MVLLAQTDEQVTSCGLLGLRLWPAAGRDEEDRVRIPPEVMTEDMKRADGVAELAGDLFRGASIDEIGSQGFIDALFGATRFEEKLAGFT